MENNEEYDMETNEQTDIFSSVSKIILVFGSMLGVLAYFLSWEGRLTKVETEISHLTSLLNSMSVDVKETRKDVKEINLYLRGLDKSGK